MPDSLQEYRTYPARFLGLFSIFMLNMATSFVWLSYAAVPDPAKEYLSCSSTVINLTSIVYFIAYIIMAPVSGWMMEKRGIKKTLLFGGLLQIVGAWIRFFGDFIDSTPESPGGRLGVTLVGQIVASGAQPFFLNLPPKFAALWFSERGRTTATMLGSISNAFSVAVAQLVIPVLTTDKASVKTTLLVCGILTIVAIVPAFFVPDRPPTPPSPSAAEALLSTVEEPFHVSLKKVCTNRQFLYLLAVFGSFVATFNAITSLIAQFSSPYNYTAEQAGYIGAAMIVAGLVGAGISGPLVDRDKQFKTLCKTLVPMGVVLLITYNFVLRKDMFIGIIVVSALLGFCMFSVLPAALELAVEITYPVTPASSASILWAFGQLMAVIFLLVLGALQDDNLSKLKSINPPMIFLGGWCLVFGITPIMLITSPYLRLEAEAQSRQLNTAESASDVKV
ncbi:hypothetical protein BG006_001060 [Podila minutissima]|uniref:Major facilitator superfamily (MFS) profile domain-containing protein n=1 Tax=Podila minutissima TaxID=64525 RepID=A0A9P5STY4_9FUNG|nr:hypothetical protein BG006_001060 [Podila minutissima]